MMNSKFQIDKNLELRFIESCIIKERRSRLLFELNSKKRNDGIDRFSHSPLQLISKQVKVSCAKSYNSNISDTFRYGGWVMFPYDNGGLEMDRDSIVKILDEKYGPIIAIAPNNVAVIKTEEDGFYILDFTNNISNF